MSPSNRRTRRRPGRGGRGAAQAKGRFPEAASAAVPRPSRVAFATPAALFVGFRTKRTGADARRRPARLFKKIINLRVCATLGTRLA
jgi:hypothetical protein